MSFIKKKSHCSSRNAKFHFDLDHLVLILIYFSSMIYLYKSRISLRFNLLFWWFSNLHCLCHDSLSLDWSMKPSSLITEHPFLIGSCSRWALCYAVPFLILNLIIIKYYSSAISWCSRHFMKISTHYLPTGVFSEREGTELDFLSDTCIKFYF